MRTRSENSVAGVVRKGIEKGGPGELWTYADFKTLPLMAVAAALSRLAREGTIRRIRKGVYYSPRKTRFGELSPNPTSVVAVLLKDKGIDWKPSGLPAYNGLGLTTQVSPTLTLDVPKKIYSLRTGSDMKLRLRLGVSVSGLSDNERAVLDALRDLRRIPDSSPAEAASKIKDLFAAKRFSFNRLARRSLNEPPRVRALLGAIGAEVGADRKELAVLRKSLNPMTTYRLGVSEALSSAKEWRIH
jgi:Family of unknown function (DUF6088)